MKKNRFTGKAKAFFFMLGAVTLTALSCAEKDSDLVKPKTITDVLRENPEFSTFREIVIATGMSDALRTSNMTLFIPDNAAFARANLSASQVTAKPDSAKIFVNYHIIEGIANRSQLTPGTRKTIDGKTVRVTRGSDSTVFVNNSEIVVPNINIDNGIMHVIDSVLVRVR